MKVFLVIILIVIAAELGDIADSLRRHEAALNNIDGSLVDMRNK